MTVALFPVSDKRIGHVRKYADRDGGAMRNEKFGHRRFGSQVSFRAAQAMSAVD